MRKTIGLTGAAVAALLLAMAPAGAVSLNLGGSGGLLGGSSSGGSGGVNVTVGGSGGLLDLGGSDTGVNVDLGNANGDILGGNDLVDLNGGNDAAVNLDLFGAPGGVTQRRTATVNLGNDGQDAAIVSLFGAPGSSDTASISLLGGGTGGLGQNTDATISLFGGGNNAGVDPTQTGSTGGPGGNANGDGTEIFTPGAQPTGRTIRPNANRRVAAVGQASCFTPDPGQINNLLGRTSYSVAVTSSWKSADRVRLVPINLCADARADLEAALAADANIGFLHSAVAADPEIRAALNPGYGPADVLAVDKTGQDLTVYVY